MFEFFLTVLLLFAPAYLLAEVTGSHWQYLAFCLVVGFGFSRFFAAQQKGLIKLLMPIAALADLAWVIYSIFNSNFMYREVIAVIVKGILVLSAILSFDAYLTPMLGYIQALSVSLFMASLVFAKNYDKRATAVVLIYFVVWFMILKVKFYGMFKRENASKEKMHYSVFLSLVAFAVILYTSWLFFSSFPLGKFTKGGLFLEPGGHSEKGRFSLEKEYYEIQDRIQERIIRLLPELHSQDEQYTLLAFLSSLAQESPAVMEIEKAKNGLIDYLHRPGLGLEEKETEDLTLLINDYVDRKTDLNIKRNEGNFRKSLKNTRLSMQNRLQANSNINKILGSDSPQRLNKHEAQSTSAINNYPLGRNEKNELNELSKELSGWKGYQLYNRKIKAYGEKIDSLQGEMKREFQDALWGIKKAETLQDFKNVAEKIQALKDKNVLKGGNAMEDMQEISGLKLGMLLKDKEEQLKRQIEGSGLFDYDAQKLKKLLDELRTSGDRELARAAGKLKEVARESGLKSMEGINDFIKAKAYFSVEEKKGQIEKLLNENVPVETRKKILEDFGRLQSEEDYDKFDSGIEAMKEGVRRLSEQGRISEDSRDELLQEVEEFRNLIQSQAGTTEKHGRFVGQQEWEDLLDSPSLEAGESQLLKELTAELLKTDTLAEFNSIREEIAREIEPLPQEFKAAFDEFADIKRVFIMEKALSGLREKIAEMEKIDASGAQILEEDLRKMRSAKTNEELEKEIEKIKQDIEARELEKKTKNWTADTGLELHVIPNRAIMAVGSSLPLKIFAVYNNAFLKELDSGVEWSSARPDLAWVDAKGIVYSTAAGRAVIHARYKEAWKNIEITVVENIDEKIGAEIKQDLIR